MIDRVIQVLLLLIAAAGLAWAVMSAHHHAGDDIGYQASEFADTALQLVDE